MKIATVLSGALVVSLIANAYLILELPVIAQAPPPPAAVQRLPDRRMVVSVARPDEPIERRAVRDRVARKAE